MKYDQSSMQNQNFLGRGFAFPPSFSQDGSEVEMVANEEDILQSIQILLGTSRGERVMQETFGCDLTSLLFEEGDQWLINRIELFIRDSIVDHEPRVTLEEVTVNGQDIRAGMLRVSVRYLVRGTNSRFNMVFPFYLTEATLPMR